MGNNKLRREIIELISDITGTDIKRDNVKISFMKGSNVDSLMALEIVAALEKKYKIEIKEEDFPKLDTLEDTIKFVEKLIKEKQMRQKDTKKMLKIKKIRSKRNTY